tara:strand:- start:117 stop:227 length:111 start_codon:yes stop_codon:yes gene_type:complete
MFGVTMQVFNKKISDNFCAAIEQGKAAKIEKNRKIR